tara:strand:- start:2420 stop:2629 length:210 start_codon:yes stop_codon:yes gene_type:complete
MRFSRFQNVDPNPPVITVVDTPEKIKNKYHDVNPLCLDFGENIEENDDKVYGSREGPSGGLKRYFLQDA